MDLQKRFQAARMSKITPLEILKHDKEYSITQAWRVGCIVMFVIRDIHDYINNEQIIFLPSHYGIMICNEDIESINNERVWINLIYRKDGTLKIE
jgi:hypothetical protein